MIHCALRFLHTLLRRVEKCYLCLVTKFFIKLLFSLFLDMDLSFLFLCVGGKLML